MNFPQIKTNILPAPMTEITQNQYETTFYHFTNMRDQISGNLNVHIGLNTSDSLIFRLYDVEQIRKFYNKMEPGYHQYVRRAQLLPTSKIFSKGESLLTDKVILFERCDFYLEDFFPEEVCIKLLLDNLCLARYFRQISKSTYSKIEARYNKRAVEFAKDQILSRKNLV